MSWTSPRTWLTGELVTAALLNTHVRDNLNYAKTAYSDVDNGTAVFTNTVFADMDALTGTPLGGPLSVAAETGDSALVILTSNLWNTTAGQFTVVGFRVSGATTVAATDNDALYYESSNAADQIQASWSGLITGLTPGTNTFEMVARVAAGTGNARRNRITVLPR